MVYNGVDTQCWLSRKRRQQHAIWFGRITPEKGTHLAIKAALLARVCLRLYVPVHDEPYFQEAVRPLLNQRITYAGSLKRADLAREAAQASVFGCMPRWEEPFGLVTAEALSSGTPVAGFAWGALPEIVTPDTGILVEENVSALASAIKKARQFSAQACRQRAIRLFSLDSMVQGYINLYQNQLRRPNNSPLLLVS